MTQSEFWTGRLAAAETQLRAALAEPAADEAGQVRRRVRLAEARRSLGRLLGPARPAGATPEQLAAARALAAQIAAAEPARAADPLRQPRHAPVYRLTPAPEHTCPQCGGAVFCLAPATLRPAHAAFYLCGGACRTVAQLAVGPVGAAV